MKVDHGPISPDKLVGQFEDRYTSGELCPELSRLRIANDYKKRGDIIWSYITSAARKREAWVEICLGQQWGKQTYLSRQYV